MPDNDSILLKTAKEEIKRIKRSDLWQSMARLYSAAVLQMNKAPVSIEIPDFPDLDIIRNLPVSLSSSKSEVKEYLKILKFIIKLHKSSKKDRMSDAACYLVQISGPPLYERLKFIIDTTYSYDPSDSHRPSNVPSKLFKVHLNNTHYVLMLSHTDNYQKGDSFADLLGTNMPGDGWDEKNQKLYPPLLRLVPCIENNPDNIPNIFYLSRLNPKVDEALNSVSADQGLGLAALPMHRDLLFDVEKIGKTKGGLTRFRIQEAKIWPEGWEKELEEQILLCSKNKIAIAALPEFCGSPKILEVVRKTLVKCKNNFPLLFIAGSWHSDQDNSSLGNGSFVNRLTVLSAVDLDPYDPYDPLITHDKFVPFSENGYTEGNEHETKGLSFLVTSLGVIAFGICKDLFMNRASGMEAISSNQLNAALPFLSVCPAMTASTRELNELATSLFKHLGSALLVSNACGFVREKLRNGICCKTIQNKEGEKKTSDARSFIAAPKYLYQMDCFKDDKSIISSEFGICIAHSSCLGQKGQDSLKAGQTNNNTVSACLKLKTEN